MIGGRIRTIGGVLVVVLAALLTPDAVAGFDEGDVGDDPSPGYFAPDDFGPGACDRSVLSFREVTTCRFPLTGVADQEFHFALHAYVESDVPAAPDVSAKALPFGSSRCHISPPADPIELVCADLFPDFAPGVQEVLLGAAVDSIPGRALASIEIVEQYESVAEFFGGARVKTIVAGSEWVLGGYRRSGGDCGPEEGLVEDQGDVEDEVPPGEGSPVPTCDDPPAESGSPAGSGPVDVFAQHADPSVDLVRTRLLEAGERESNGVILRLDEPGRYDTWTCEVADDGTCRAEGHHLPVHALRPDVEPLVPGQTRDDPSSRIHVVAVGSGWEGADEEFRAAAYRMLGLDLSVADETGLLGPFGIEPLRSNVGRFDFWFMPEHAPSRLGVNWLDGDQVSTDPLGLGPYVVIVNLSRNGAVDGARANAGVPTIFGAQDLGPKADIRFADFHLPFEFAYDTEGLTTSAHEYGHALLGLPDEYVENQATAFVRHDYPSCASSQSEAESWWADQVGELDPFFETWREIVDGTSAAFDVESISADDLTVGYFVGGCFGGPDSTEAIRPTMTSIMNDERVQVFGAVQRRQAERLLSLWDEPDPDDNTFELVEAEVAKLDVDLPATAEEYEATRPALGVAPQPSDDAADTDDADDTGDTSTSTPDDVDTELASDTGDGDDGGISPVWIVVVLAAIAAGAGVVYLRRRERT